MTCYHPLGPATWRASCVGHDIIRTCEGPRDDQASSTCGLGVEWLGLRSQSRETVDQALMRGVNETTLVEQKDKMMVLLRSNLRTKT